MSYKLYKTILYYIISLDHTCISYYYILYTVTIYKPSEAILIHFIFTVYIISLIYNYYGHMNLSMGIIKL
jgi:hypothetical protein